MKKLKSPIQTTIVVVVLVFILVLVLAGPAMAVRGAAPRQVPRQVPSAFDLIAEVNNLRVSQGLAALEINNAIMTAAQKHSEYQAFIGSWTHSGPGGSNETDRAIAEGYGGGKKVVCDEAVAVAATTHGTDYIVYTLWADYTHRDLVMLNSRYSEVGAGTAEKDGQIYYTLDVCVVVGEEIEPQPTAPSSGTQPAATQPGGETAATVEKAPILTVTPMEDGSIIHVVQPGQTLWDIAIAYGKKVLELAAMNGISATNPVVYVNEKVVVQVSSTPTISPTVTNTPRPPTRTPRPTRTLAPTRIRHTATITLTPTSTEVPSKIPRFDLNDRRSVGMAIIVISGLGLLLVGLGNIKKKSTKKGENTP